MRNCRKKNVLKMCGPQIRLFTFRLIALKQWPWLTTQKPTKKKIFLNVCWVFVYFKSFWCSVCFCMGHFAMVPIDLTWLHIVYNIFSLKISSIYAIDTFRWFYGPEVTHPFWIREVPGSITGSGFYVWPFVFCCCFSTCFVYNAFVTKCCKLFCNVIP